MSLISKNYIEFLREHFHLDWQGIHGAPHWARVKANGLLLAEQTGADSVVVEAFAFILDAERRSDGSDPDHGPKAARLAAEINDEFFGYRQLSSIRSWRPAKGTAWEVRKAISQC